MSNLPILTGKISPLLELLNASAPMQNFPINIKFPAVGKKEEGLPLEGNVCSNIPLGLLWLCQELIKSPHLTCHLICDHLL